MQFKKPKFWDYKKPNIYSYLLLPIALFIEIISETKKKLKTKTKTKNNLGILLTHAGFHYNYIMKIL